MLFCNFSLKNLPASFLLAPVDFFFGGPLDPFSSFLVFKELLIPPTAAACFLNASLSRRSDLSMALELKISLPILFFSEYLRGDLFLIHKVTNSIYMTDRIHIRNKHLSNIWY